MHVTLPRRAFLGAELPGDAEAFTDDGVWIAGVAPDTMAAHAGLAAGDLLVSLAGQPVRNLSELAAALRCAGGQSTTELVVRREAETITSTTAVITLPHEQHAGSEVDYGELAASGLRLRTIATRAPSPRGLVLVLQGIACESIDHATSADAPLAGLMSGLARAGYDTLRCDKRGVGDSEGGPCNANDFHTELADARAALALAAAQARARAIPLIVFGHSVGGIIAALVAHDQKLAGIIVYGTPVMPWIECLLDSTRRQLELHAAPAAEIEHRLAAIRELARNGDLNGRSAAYHAQLASIDIAAAWRTVDVPVLVVRGEHDWVVRDDDQAQIAALARGETTIVDLLGLDHLFGWHADREASLRDYGIGAFHDSIVDATLAWLDRLGLQL